MTLYVSMLCYHTYKQVLHVLLQACLSTIIHALFKITVDQQGLLGIS